MSKMKDTQKNNKKYFGLFLLLFSVLGLFCIAALSFSASTYIYPGGITTGNLSSDFVNAYEISAGTLTASIISSLSGIFSKLNITNVMYAYNASINFLTTTYTNADNVSAGNIRSVNLFTTNFLSGNGRVTNLQSDVVNATNFYGSNATFNNVTSKIIRSLTLQSTNVSAENVSTNEIYVYNTAVAKIMNTTKLNANNISTLSVYSNDIYTQDIQSSDNIKANIINAKNISANNVTAINVTATTIIANKIQENDLEFGQDAIGLTENTSISKPPYLIYYGTICPYSFKSTPVVIVTPVVFNGTVPFKFVVENINTTCFTVVLNSTSSLKSVIVDWFAKAS